MTLFAQLNLLTLLSYDTFKFHTDKTVVGTSNLIKDFNQNIFFCQPKKSHLFQVHIELHKFPQPLLWFSFIKVQNCFVWFVIDKKNIIKKNQQICHKPLSIYDMTILFTQKKTKVI